MKHDLKKLEELLKNDEEFKQKLLTAGGNYRGEMTGKAIFLNVFAPIAKEYGLSITYEDMGGFLNPERTSAGELDPDEMSRVSGGKHAWSRKDENVCVTLGTGCGADDFCVAVGSDPGMICQLK